MAARGDPVVWIMSLALLVCVVMIAVLVVVITSQGLRTFWPRAIDRVTTRSGEVFLGVATETEASAPAPSELRQIEQMREAGTLPPDALDARGRPLRRLYRVGNRDIGQDPFRWVPVHSIVSVERPAAALFVERESWSVWIGTLEAVTLVDDLGPDAPIGPARPVETELGPGVAPRVATLDHDGHATVVERTRIPAPSLTVGFQDLHRQARARRAEIERVTRVELGRLNARIEGERQAIRAAERRVLQPGQAAPPGTLGLGAWSLLIMLTAALVAAGTLLWRGGGDGVESVRRRSARCCWIAAAAMLVGVITLHPWARATLDPGEVAVIRARGQERERALLAEYQSINRRRLELERADARFRVEIVEPRTGRFAPRSLSEPGEPMPISSIVRVVPGNELSIGARVGVYLSRWREFLLADPREVNTEGGVYPVIFGTVLLTILLTIVVLPLGVVAAIYIREYARQGLVISVIRVAINNLAGVPSIVYGVFGLGFFCYTLGKYIDTGPAAAMAPTGSLWSFWPMLGVLTIVAMAGACLGLLGSPPPGAPRRPRRVTVASGAVWGVCAVLALVLIARTPYFGGFFADKAPSPTFGTRGILWGALTLALLTLPVVIVATEEAIAAVPRSMREGSHACGATTWQTIRGIVLPGAMPGILTGAILAMARGAGEVAPLMLVGAAKQAPNLPLTGEFPFIHADRSFMHLGFHIYDLGLQSPDSQAARPLVWTTTLLLLVVVLAMNLAAILLRSRLRARSVSVA